jgi:HEAT repeat protein
MMAMARDESFGLAVRKTALFWSGHLGDESVVGMLVGFIRADVHPDLRESAVFALSQQGSESAASALQDIAEDSGEVSTLRERAIFWLGQRRTESHEYLRELYQSIGDPELKERIIFAVSQRATDEDWEWLIERAASGSESIELRKKAMFWAGQSRHEMSDLIDLYDRLESRELKENLVFVYSQRRHDDAALDKLFEIARQEGDTQLRGKAIFWLGQSRDPRVIQFLAELIG